MDVESTLKAQPRLRTDSELCAIALHNLRLHDCNLVPPVSRSEWRDRNAKTEGRAEGKIKGPAHDRPQGLVCTWVVTARRLGAGVPLRRAHPVDTTAARVPCPMECVVTRWSA